MTKTHATTCHHTQLHEGCTPCERAWARREERRVAEILSTGPQRIEPLGKEGSDARKTLIVLDWAASNADYQRDVRRVAREAAIALRGALGMPSRTPASVREARAEAWDVVHGWDLLTDYREHRDGVQGEV